MEIKELTRMKKNGVHINELGKKLEAYYCSNQEKFFKSNCTFNLNDFTFMYELRSEHNQQFVLN